MPTGDRLLEIANARVQVGSTRVFDGLDLSIGRGENTAVLGPNGAGKTTLLRLLTRDLYPEFRPGSHVKVLGRDRWNVFELRNQLGIVSPDLQAVHQRAVMGCEVVLSGYFSSVGLYRHQEVSAEQRERAAEVMAQLRIDGLAGRRFPDMSLGEQRRFLLGRALVHSPHTLVLDEPTTGLDLQGAFQLLALLEELADAGRTLVLVTHHVYEIAPCIDRVVLLHRGGIRADGHKSEILTAPLLSEVYGVEVELVERDGRYQAFPARHSP